MESPNQLSSSDLPKKTENKIKKIKMQKIKPKQAWLALKAIKSYEISDFIINRESGTEVAEVTVNNRKFNGQGSTELIAKNNASEKALKDIVLTNTNKNCLPIQNILQFSLYELYRKWGIPDNERNVNRQNLPKAWKQMGASQVLNLMRPQHSWTTCAMDEGRKNHHVIVTVDGEQYSGFGRKVKNAREEASKKAINNLFNTEEMMETATKSEMKATSSGAGISGSDAEKREKLD